MRYGTRSEVVIIPIKPFSEAKTRLSGAFGPAQRAEIAQRLARRVLTAVRDARLGAIVVTADSSARISAVEFDAVLVNEELPAGLNAAWHLGIQEAESLGFASALLLPADLPLVKAADIRAAMRRPGIDGIVLSPSRDGDGTNALCIPLPSPIRLSYGPGSFARHVRSALDSGAGVRVIRRPGLVIDVDHPADLSCSRDPDDREQTSLASTLRHGQPFQQ